MRDEISASYLLFRAVDSLLREPSFAGGSSLKKREYILLPRLFAKSALKANSRLSQTHEREEKTLSQRDDDTNDACSRFSSRANLNPKQRNQFERERIFFPLIFPQ